MNLEPLRRLQSKLSVAFVAATALFLTSCGGGGATSSPTSVGPLQLLPSAATIYAGVPYTANIVGGRKPYLVTSSEQSLIELNFTTDSNEFTFVARNPGVVDVGLDENEVPRRSVNIEVRDSNGTTISNTYSVLQNFFTGYRESYTNTCPVPEEGTAPQACAGNDTIVLIAPVSNGLLFGNRELQFDRLRGDFSFVVENPATIPQLVNTIRVRTDQTGIAIVRLRVPTTAPTQLATYRVTDVLSGATMEAVFLIVGAPETPMTLVPSALTFTGSLTTRCGAGTGDVFVFGGTPPYAVTASSTLTISPTTIAAPGGRFSVTVGAGTPPCLTGRTVVVTDSRGQVATLVVTVSPGTATPPALVVAPTTIASLLCGQSAQVTVVGGTGAFTANSQHPGITATVSGTTLTVTRRATDTTPPPPYPTSGTVTVTDGATIATVTITATPATCP